MKRIIYLIVALMLSVDAFSQSKLVLTEGTRYMVAFPQVQASPSEKPLPQPMQLFISSKVKTKVRVQTPAVLNDNVRIDREYSIEPNKVTRISIPTTYMNVNSQTRTGYGIFVSSTKPISVSTYQAWMGNGELARHLPIEAWGKNYYSANMYQDRYGTQGAGYKYRPSQILIIASRDNTVVSYTPTWDTEGGNEMPGARKGETQTVTLEKGETYLIKGKIDENFNKEWSTDLSGTLIKSNKPIGVIAGHVKVGILRYPDELPPTGMFRAEAHFVRNNVHDAMLPFEMTGTEFVTIPSMYTPLRNQGAGQAGAEIGIEDDRGDVIRFIALEDGTLISRMRINGTGFAPERMLKRGESFLATSLQDATFWKADKPVICSQYGKSYAKVLPPIIKKEEGEGVQGHPTVESGMPMMEYVPSVDRWTNYGVFHSPEGMDNFLNIVFKMEDVSKIEVDGRALSSAFGGAMRPLQGTPYSVIRTPIGTGDHSIESIDPKVRWMAWTYGSLDGLQQGRAYGTPLSIDVSIPCDDSLEIESQVICGDVDGKVKLLPENSSCGQLFAFTMEDEMNYILEADLDALSDSKIFSFKLKVIDKKKSAYAKVIVVTRSGNWIEKEFRYDGIDLAFDPKEVNFGTQPYGRKICTTVVVKNLQPTTVTIEDLKFRIQEFSVTPNSLQLGPNESKQIQVCGVINIPGRRVDTLIAKINCIDLKYLPVEIRGEEPLFYAGDQNWGILPKNSKQTKQVELINAGKVDVILTEYQPRGDAYFTNSTLIKYLPLTLKPGQRFTYDIDYSPNGEMGIPHQLRIDYTTNAEKEKLYSNLKGQGSDAQVSVTSFSWTERVIDTYQQSKGIFEYSGLITIQNLGNAVSTIKTVSIEGGMAGIFSWAGDVMLYNSMSPSDTRTLKVFFKPFEMPLRDAERRFASELVIKYIVNGEEKEARGVLEGTALQPMIHLTSQDWKSRPVNSVTGLPIEITNKNLYAFAPLTSNEGGTMNLLLDSLVITGTEPFTWTSTGTNVIAFNPPISITSLETVPMFVDFSPRKPGVYKTTYRFYGNIPDTATASLMGETPGESKVEPISLLTWIGTTTTGTVRGTSAYNTLLKFKEFRGGDYILFGPSSSAPLTPFQVDPSVPFSYEIEFTPNKVTKNGLKSGQNLNGRLPYQDDRFYTTIVFEDANGNELIGDVFGDGKYLETTLRIVADKNVNIDASANVSFWLDPTPESIDSGNVESARLRVRFDNGLLYPKLLSNKNFPTALLIEEKLSTNMLEIDLVTSNQVDGYLGKKEFQSLLYSKNFSNIDGEYYTINKGNKIASSYVVINVIPDVLTVIPVCANVKRIIEVGGSYGIVIKNNVVEVSVGIDAPLTITSVNELGQQTIIFNGFVKKGTYNFMIQSKGLQWLIARQADWIETQGVLVD